MNAAPKDDLLKRFSTATPEVRALVSRILESCPDANGPSKPAQPRELLNKKEFAARAKVTVRCLENWMARGIVPFLKIKKVVLFDWDDAVEHLKAHHQVRRRNLIP
jgi:hypothetical protein